MSGIPSESPELSLYAALPRHEMTERDPKSVAVSPVLKRAGLATRRNCRPPSHDHQVISQLPKNTVGGDLESVGR